MSRYIDAEALIERILKLKVVTDDMYGMGIARGIERVETAIQMQPTADVVEVKHGEYIQKGAWHIECSVCRNVLAHIGEVKNYCPNCGAKMDGEERK